MRNAPEADVTASPIEPADRLVWQAVTIAAASPPEIPGGTSRGPLVRWLLSYGSFSVPQAAGPIAFALLAIPLTGDPTSGAAIMLTMTIAQVAGAVPIARLGRNRNAVAYLRLLVATRTLALLAVALLASARAPFAFLVAAAACAGLVNGAAFGYLRSVLNDLIEPARLPRALGMAATLSEFTFVVAPIAASGLGSLDPVAAVLVLSLLGAAPVFLVPSLRHAKVTAPAGGRSSLLTLAIVPWLACTAATSSVVSSIEIGAVSLAVDYGFPPALGIIFTVALCVASVAGGVWVSLRNRIPARATILFYLVLMSLGASLIALHLSIVVTVLGAVTAGCVLAPLSTSYSLMLDARSPPHRKAEVFALSRTSHALGVILTSANLTFTSLAVTQAVAALLIVTVTLATGAGLVSGAAGGRE